MAVDLECVECFTFDSFTPIVDVHQSTRRALAKYVDDPDPIATLWRFRAVDYRMLVNFCGHYGTYEDTTRDALKYALAANGVDLTDDEVDDILGVFHELDVFDDVRPCMETIVGQDYDVFIASNGNEELLQSMIERANIDDLVVDTVSANEIEVYKPDLEFYRHVANRINFDTSSIAHVATPWYDVYGAMNAGMVGIWVNRESVPWDEYDGDPDLTVDGLNSLVEMF